MDDDIIDITDYSERPANDRRSPQHKQKYVTHTVTQGHCPTPQTSPTYIAMNAAATAPAKAALNGNLGNPPGQEKNTPRMAHMFEETANQGKPLETMTST